MPLKDYRVFNTISSETKVKISILENPFHFEVRLNILGTFGMIYCQSKQAASSDTVIINTCI